MRRGILAAKRGGPQAATALLLRRLPPDLAPPGSIVTWVPGHPLRTVGAPDAGRALATAVAVRAGLPLRPLLRRSPLGRRQAGRSDLERCAEPHRLGLSARPVPHGTSVVVVDDVRTTGTTLDHAAELLRAAGAAEVVAVVVAAAPSSLDR
ncbi:MAG: phosphoribosyltransferase family protein [Solirubrobacteraceae bacterium]|nr:phosphoribosyltransferase family protein [Patulibacter sp.]